MSVLSPYFESLSKQRRICPECGTRFLRVEPSGCDDPDFAWDVCDCGHMEFREAPDWAKLGTGPRGVPDNSPSTVARELNERLAARQRREEGKAAQLIKFRPRGA